jgi:hypothetical protein
LDPGGLGPQAQNDNMNPLTPPNSGVRMGLGGG